jgi:hypothetical protein
MAADSDASVVVLDQAVSSSNVPNDIYVNGTKIGHNGHFRVSATGTIY